MRLSEAIRKGSDMRPQVFGSAIGWTPLGNLGTCALGAAFEGAGFRFDTHSQGDEEFVAMFPMLHQTVNCPKCDSAVLHGTLARNIIMHMNDFHRWSREAIAMWVETLEDACQKPVDAATKTDSSNDTMPSAPPVDEKSSCVPPAGLLTFAAPTNAPLVGAMTPSESWNSP